MEDNYQNLANAVVALAAKDYMKVLRALKKSPHSKIQNDEREQLERFFRSGLFSIYTSVDPEYLIDTMKEACA